MSLLLPENVPSAKKASDVLRASNLQPTQLELLGDDVDLQEFYITLGVNDLDMVDAVTDIVVDRTIEGASMVTVTVEDRDRVFLRSGILSNKFDTEIDGLFFRLAEVTKSGSTLTLTFEDREVAFLREYDKPIKQSLATSRAQVTRAQFILRMLREVKEEHIRYVIPELTVTQAIGTAVNAQDSVTKAQNRATGIPRVNENTVKGVAMTENQRVTANAILDAGSSMNMTHAELVMSIMCVIDESSITNLLPGVPGAYNYLGPDIEGNPVGAFQQIPKYWSGRGGASRDVTADATAFFGALDPIVKGSPSEQYADSIERVQNSGDASHYAPFKDEAERIVTSYGSISGPLSVANAQVSAVAKNGTANGDYEFYRGQPPSTNQKGWKPESSWDCIQRLAQEVQYRAFFVSGIFYWIDDDDLFKSQPIAVLDEDTVGVISIDGDYISNSKSASVNLVVNSGRWVAPPGTVIQLVNMGVWNGRWLVNDITRSLFNPQATITLKKALPALPEPSGGNISGTSTSGSYTGTAKIGANDKADPPAGPAATTAVAYAKSQLGVPYGYGDEEMGVSFDCSGLTQAAYAAAGISIPHNAQAQYDQGPVVQRNNLRVGDLVYFGTSTSTIEHVGIYVGGNQMIDAPHTGAFVRYDANFFLWNDPTYQGATRPSAG